MSIRSMQACVETVAQCPTKATLFGWLREQLATSRLPSQDVIDVMKLPFEHVADCVL